MKKLFTFIIILNVISYTYSQNYKLGKVSKEELQEQYYPSDSSANAAYLYKNRRTYFDFRQGEGFLVITEVHERIKIYNKDGYDWATKEIIYYSPESGDKERVSIKEAKTFSLIDGKIKSFKLGKKSVFNERLNKYREVKKFTMPNISDGCVVEWNYKIASPYRSIDNVELQHSIPIKKFKSSIEIPEFFKYKVKQIGYLPINENIEVKNSSVNISGSYRSGNTRYGYQTNFVNDKVDYKTKVSQIEKFNIPALIEEPYVNDIDNYRAAIDYELTTIQWPNQPAKHFSKSWDDVARTIILNPDFGSQIEKVGHLKDDLSNLKTSLTSPAAKVFGALDYVKNKIKWNGYYGKFVEKGLRKAYKDGTGNIAEINLTLVAVLKELGVNAYPVLVSTRSNGVPNFPTISGFNYVIVLAETIQGNVLLDASEKYSLPNVLPLRALNWQGAIVRPDKSIDFVNLGSTTLSLEESNLIYKIADDGSIEGMNRAKYKNYAAMRYRKRYGSIKEEDVISKIEENNDDIEIIDFKTSNINTLSKPVAVLYKFEKEDGVEIIGDKMYITPLLFSAAKENPFKLDKRDYPIDFGTPIEEKMKVSIQLPEGYSIETLPKNLAIGMNEGLGTFTYSVKQNGNKIQVSSNIKINRDVIPATYYSEIKELFKQIVSKQSEKIVLAKN